jgi:AcrR family transcriptional regulator
LDAAERLFAEHGFDGASMRQITEAARVNVAAVNYHFGSKEELYCQVFVRRIVPVNQRRTELMDRAEEKAAGGSIPLAAIFDSFIRPVFEMADRAPSFLRLLARNIGAPPPFMAALLETQFRPLITRFLQALRVTLPDLPPQTIFWRMHFVIGATLHCASHHLTIHQLSGGLCCTDDMEVMLAHLIDFAVAGMSAPAPIVPRTPPPSAN